METILRHPGGLLQRGDHWIPADETQPAYREILALQAEAKAEIRDAPAPAPDNAVGVAAVLDVIEELAGAVDRNATPKLQALAQRLRASQQGGANAADQGR